MKVTHFLCQRSSTELLQVLWFPGDRQNLHVCLICRGGGKSNERQIRADHPALRKLTSTWERGYLPFEHVCDGSLASVGVVGEASTLADKEMVEHEERGEVSEYHGSNGSPYDGPSTLLGFNGEDTLNNGSGETGHGWWW